MITYGPVRKWFAAHPRAADTLLATGVLLLALLVPDPDGTGPVRPSLSLTAVLLAVVTCGPLAARRVHPVPTLVLAVVGAFATAQVVDEHTVLVLAPVVALYTVAVGGERRTTRRAWAATALALIGADLGQRGGLDPGVISTVAWTVAAAALGDSLGQRRAYLAAVEERAVRAEQGREEESRRRVAEERLRIARELHDVVAHNMAVVNVQAGVAGYLLPDQPVAAQEALAHVRRAAAGILDELSDILTVLRQGEEPAGTTAPAPGLAQLDSLVTSFTAAGLAVDWSLSGRPRVLGAGVDLVAYRLVQEALTNAHKHGTGTASLTVTYLPEQVQLQVSNPVAPLSAAGEGHGLLGMRERAAAVGGALRLGADGGQFRVQAVLPLPA